jgi:hypothetical protein
MEDGASTATLETASLEQMDRGQEIRRQLDEDLSSILPNESYRKIIISSVFPSSMDSRKKDITSNPMLAALYIRDPELISSVTKSILKVLLREQLNKEAQDAGFSASSLAQELDKLDDYSPSALVYLSSKDPESQSRAVEVLTPEKQKEFMEWIKDPQTLAMVIKASSQPYKRTFHGARKLECKLGHAQNTSNILQVKFNSFFSHHDPESLKLQRELSAYSAKLPSKEESTLKTANEIIKSVMSDPLLVLVKQIRNVGTRIDLFNRLGQGITLELASGELGIGSFTNISEDTKIRLVGFIDPPGYLIDRK